MKLRTPPRWMARLAARREKQLPVAVAGPIRGELLGADALAERVRAVARSQRLVPPVRRRRKAALLTRLEESRVILDRAHERIGDAAANGVDIGPAGDWLLDNYHVVLEHVREVRESLPADYYRELPELSSGRLAGYPRVYELAITLIAHTEGRIELPTVDLVTKAFQEIAPLSIGELWAVPAMLRLGLLENVRRMALRTVQRLDEVEAADRWANYIQTAAEGEAAGRALREFIAGHPPLTPIFITRFLRQLRLSDTPFTPLLWLEEYITEEGLSGEEAAARSADRLAVTQVAMAHSIESLRAIGRMEWQGYVERCSLLEATLREDPSGFYPRMTFATRDQYRHVVERIARRTRRGETDIAAAAVRLAAHGLQEWPDDPRRHHVGYYLAAEGRAELETTAGYRPPLGEVLYRWVLHHPNLVFVGGVLAALAAVLWLGGAAARASLPIVLLIALLPAADIAVNVVNQLVTVFLPPRPLPKLDFRERGVGTEGIPAEYRTAVVVPILFGSVEAVQEALEHLEVQYLANPEAHLHFALLSDFSDARTEHQEGDVAILDAAVRGIRALNARYAGRAQDRFYLFHRPRRWNPQQGVWMGWERKRGKLAQFNRFVRGGAPDAFQTVIGDVATIRRVRYVITLDSDTVLPPDAAALLVGAMAHPLNRAVYDPERGRVVRGYGILQPRVGVSLPSAHRSRFAALHSGHPGVDPYTTAVSDVYQDLYGEGSFTGKGIYDVDAFEEATHGRFPENTLLSHDLIEGSYARAGLVSEIEVYDDYPSRYLVHARRKHRWIRGDWQLLRWLFPRVPGPDGPEPNRLSLLSRWKIFDNLRRSLTEIAQLLFLVAGWTILPGSPLRWTVLGLLAITAPWIVSLLLATVRVPADKSWRAYYAAVARDAVTSAQQVALAIVFLPHQAWLSLDAIGRTLWRLGVTRRNLLEWQTASQTEQLVAGGAASAWRTMWPAVALAATALVAAIALEWLRLRTGAPGTLLVGAAPVATEPGARLWAIALGAVPLAAAWVAAPAVAEALNAPLERRALRVPRARRRQAIRYALLHWRFFERFVGPETAWLAPDNFQETPSPLVALRTSPTNIGLQLLATVSAHDLGFITTEHMAERLERAFDALDRMRRFRGHFYNWYSLPACEVLEPAYISTVDSGNLAGHLVALRQACLELPDRPVFDQGAWRAVSAALALAEERVTASAAAAGPGPRRALAPVHEALAAARAALPRRTPAAAAGLDAVALPLRQARAAIERARTEATLSTAVATDILDWIMWTLQLLDEQRARVAALQLQAAAPSADEGEVVYPTLAELAQQDGAAATLVARLAQLAARAGALVAAMDFRFLYDPDRKLFAIGYQQATHSLDRSYYDLLASEARLASFLAVARNDVPLEHWFRLGRALTHAAGATALVSWSGSMFEYLMPLLVMESFPSTLLDQACCGAVLRQMAHGEEHGTPWGVSESAYNLRDRQFTYQYRAFGVPNLALKRGLAQDHVIAPYASALAVMVDAPKALANLAELESLGALGPYGFRDAVDFTRPDPGSRYAVVGNYMAHHVGMSLVALTNALTTQGWQRRFHNDPMVRAAELLLHERIPRRLELQETQAARATEALPDAELEAPAVREFTTADTPQPNVALLGHLPYTLMVTNAGGGYSRFEGLAVTRWRADGTRDHTGQFCYVKDVAASRVWSAAHQPVCAPADWYLALLATDRVIFHRADGEIETRTEICVVPADAAEVRRVTVTNNGREPRQLELTSYGEVVLAPPDADRAHPAFANLFVETEWHEWCSAITATRRPRSASERTLWGVHVVTAPGAGEERIGAPTCETDRARFLGRGRSPRTPLALERDGPLPGSVGAVLDPLFAIRVRLLLDPGRSASVAFTTLVAPTRDRAFALADRYHDPQAAQRALDMAWTSAQVELRELNISPSDAALYQELAGHLFFGDPALGAPPEERQRNRGSQPQLWALGISGDWPILLATIDSKDGLPTLRQLFAAHRYWRRRGMTVDLVVLNTLPTSYLQELHEDITAILFSSSEAGIMDQPGGVFVRRIDAVSPADLLMLRATARVHIACDGRSLARAVSVARPRVTADEDDFVPALPHRSARPAPASLGPFRGALRGLFVPNGRAPGGDTDAETIATARHDAPAQASHAPDGSPHVTDGTGPPLRFDNGFGGLAANDDYVVRVRGDELPPAPWINVVANPQGGFIVSERGAGSTWAVNSYFFRLTPWHNDPVTDPPGDVIYIRDEETGEFWSATPAPAGAPVSCTVTHGAGASTFAHEYGGIASLLTVGVPEHDAVKLSILRLKNLGASPRRLTITAYAEWTLGAEREHTRHQVHTTFDPDLGAIFARNGFNPQFAEQVAFCALSEPVVAHSGDRREFLGRNGDLASPAALLADGELTGATGAALDPCATLQCTIELAPGESRELVVLLGAAEGRDAASRLVREYRSTQHAVQAVAGARAAWAARLGTIRVHTPEPSFDAMLNRWTLYQALACRMWARSALYQSSGAYGFRDQLQDVMAFVYAEPALAREHILRAAARQFVEGDVQHWWHPQSGRGVRTRFSDDLAWLPFVVDHYLRVTGDSSVLDETVPFLTMRELAPHEHEVYDVPQVSDERASLHEHCLRGLGRACTRGDHGLPLIGSGDWNDGFSRVGIEGRGESVWLAWFLAATLRAYAAHTEARGDVATAADFRATADAYTAAVEAHGWDGEWYRRAYFDDGTPLGSAHAEECRIDSIAQSWSVISGEGDPVRQAEAMASLERHLVNDQARLLLLLTPPFDTMPQDPGYIKGYLPGVRENGAQYTHAALWAVLATALRGAGDRAFELYQMVNPLTHAATTENAAAYKVEPYVVAADVYTAAGQLGRGGWTWYTGSASWMYRVGLESILGFTRRGSTLLISPRVPAGWQEYRIEYRFGGSTWAITVHEPAALGAHGAAVTVDGRQLDTAAIPLVDDGARHEVTIRPRSATAAPVA